MNLTETAQVMAKISFFDSRPITKPTIAAWHEILAPYDYQLALDAVAAHYAQSPRWVMPANIVTYIREHDPATWDKAAIDRVLGGTDYWSPPSPPEGMDLDAERAWIRQAHAEHLEARRAQAAKVVRDGR